MRQCGWMHGNAEQIRQRERIAGLLLIGAAALGMAAANSPLADFYHTALETQAGPFSIHRWISDVLMAFFFLLVGLEVKREWLTGQLSRPSDRRLPLVAAAAGMAAPAIVYLVVTAGDPGLVRGWAVPAATDIAFAVGILALFGSRVPPSIKLMLVTIAIADDIGAVAIIAFAYSGSLHIPSLFAVALIVALMISLNQLGVKSAWPYLAGFAVTWLFVERSGIHATVAGVLAALAVPIGDPGAPSPLRQLEHRLHPWVMLGIMPLFGLANAGVHLAGGGAMLASPVALAVAVALFAGKQAGIFGAIALMVRLRFAARPREASWPQIYGASLLCGIGFTMSLFIAALAFPSDPGQFDAARLGVLAGSLLSAIAGAAVLGLAPAQVEPDWLEEQESEAIFAGGEGQ